MKNKVLLVAILIMILPNITGCAMTKEIEHLEYSNAIGIDYKDDRVYMYIQFINFANIAKQQGATREPEVIAIGKGEGNSIEEAVVDIYNSTQQRIAWSQTKSIIFSKAALENKTVVKEWLDIMNRYYEFRYTLWTFGTDTPMAELLNTKQLLNISSLYSRLTDPMDMYNQNSFIKPIYMYEFRREWHEPGNTILLPVLSVRANNWTENLKVHPMFEVSGVFPLINRKYTTFLPKEKMPGLRWMNDKTIRSPLFLKGRKHIMLRKPNVKIIPSNKRNDHSFVVEIKVKGSLTSQMNSVSQPILEKEAEKEIQDEVMKTYLYALENKVDIFKLSHALYRKDNKKWDKVAENGNLPLNKDSLKPP